MSGESAQAFLLRTLLVILQIKADCEGFVSLSLFFPFFQMRRALNRPLLKNKFLSLAIWISKT